MIYVYQLSSRLTTIETGLPAYFLPWILNTIDLCLMANLDNVMLVV